MRETHRGRENFNFRYNYREFTAFWVFIVIFYRYMLV